MPLSINNNNAVQTLPLIESIEYESHYDRFLELFNKYVDPNDVTFALNVARKIDKVKAYLETGKRPDKEILTFDFESTTANVMEVISDVNLSWNTKEDKKIKVESYIKDLERSIKNKSDSEKKELLIMLDNIKYLLLNSSLEKFTIIKAFEECKASDQTFENAFIPFNKIISRLVEMIDSFKSSFRDKSKTLSDELEAILKDVNKPKNKLFQYIAKNIDIPLEKQKDIETELDYFASDLFNSFLKGLNAFTKLSHNSFNGLCYNPEKITQLLSIKKSSPLEYFYVTREGWKSTFDQTYKFESHIFNDFDQLIELSIILENYFLYFKTVNLDEIVKMYDECKSSEEFHYNLKMKILTFSNEIKNNMDLLKKSFFYENDQLKKDAVLYLQERKEYQKISEKLIYHSNYLKLLRLQHGYTNKITFKLLSENPSLIKFSQEKEALRNNLIEESNPSEVKSKKKIKKQSFTKPKTQKEEIDEVKPIALVPVNHHHQSIHLLCQIQANIPKAKNNLTSQALTAYKNASDQFNSLIQAMHRVMRFSKNSFTREELSEWVILTALKGYLTLEQLYSAILLQKNPKAELNHDLMDLIERCDFSNQYPLYEEELELAYYSNYGEIQSRFVPKIAKSAPVNNQDEIKDLLIDAYQYAQGNKAINLQQLINQTVSYFSQVAESFFSLQRFLKSKVQPDLSIHKFTQSIGKWLKDQGLSPTPSKLSVIRSQINKSLAPAMKSKKLSVKDSIVNIQFLSSMLDAELNALSNPLIQELALIQSRILMLGYLIIEESLYLKANLSYLDAPRQEIKHDLIKLAQITHVHQQLTSQEKDYLKKFKETFHYMRYGNDSKNISEVAQTSNKAKDLSKKSQLTPIPLKAEEGFSTVVDQESLNASASVSSYVSSQIALLDSILIKIFN